MVARQTVGNRYDKSVGYAPGYVQCPLGSGRGYAPGLCTDRPFVGGGAGPPTPSWAPVGGLSNRELPEGGKPMGV